MEDPRGPMRRIVAVEPTSACTWVTFDCGHISEMNQIYTYKVGALSNCFHCGPHGTKPVGAKHYATQRPVQMGGR